MFLVWLSGKLTFIEKVALKPSRGRAQQRSVEGWGAAGFG